MRDVMEQILTRLPTYFRNPSIVEPVYFSFPSGNSMEPMLVRDVMRLEEGDHVFIRWAKDDDPDDIRMDDVCEVRDNDGTRIVAPDHCWEWDYGRADPEDSHIDTGRGFAYFYWPDEPVSKG